MIVPRPHHSAAGIAPNPEKVDAVKRFPVPTSVKGVRQFLGLASYYRRFIPGFAKIVSPLHALTHQDIPFFWTLSCQEAFVRLKDLLLSPPVLAYPNFAQLFVLHTDASQAGLGAVLEQEGGVLSITCSWHGGPFVTYPMDCCAT